MKTLAALFGLAVSTVTFAQTTAPQNIYKCDCVKGTCEGQEHIMFMVKSADQLKVLLSDEEYEFSANLKAKKSTKVSPIVYPGATRYDTSKSADFTGTMSFMIDNKILSTWLPAEEGKKKGKLVSIDQKTGTATSVYSCVAESDDYWVYNP